MTYTILILKTKTQQPITQQLGKIKLYFLNIRPAEFNKSDFLVKTTGMYL